LFQGSSEVWFVELKINKINFKKIIMNTLPTYLVVPRIIRGLESCLSCRATKGIKVTASSKEKGNVNKQEFYFP
jgi:hypothetical protein